MVQTQSPELGLVSDSWPGWLDGVPLLLGRRGEMLRQPDDRE